MKTVNVITILSGVIDNVTSFSESVAGNRKAEKLFSKLIKENQDDKFARQWNSEDEDIESYIENGYYENGNYNLVLVHSS